MSTQKTYQFPKSGGGEITKTLAIGSPVRIERFLDFFGKKSYSEFTTEEGERHYSLTMLNTAVEREKLVQIMDICLQEKSVDLDFDSEDFDTRVSDGVIQDFFELRAKNLRERHAS